MYYKHILCGLAVLCLSSCCKFCPEKKVPANVYLIDHGLVCPQPARGPNLALFDTKQSYASIDNIKVVKDNYDELDSYARQLESEVGCYRRQVAAVQTNPRCAVISDMNAACCVDNKEDIKLCDEAKKDIEKQRKAVGLTPTPAPGQ